MDPKNIENKDESYNYFLELCLRLNKNCKVGF